jgi:hypothetical protein
VASPAWKNSNKTCKSSNETSALAKAVVQLFFSCMDLRTASAFLGSFQKPGASVIFSSSAMSSSLASTSKKPPQRFESL